MWEGGEDLLSLSWPSAVSRGVHSLQCLSGEGVKGGCPSLPLPLQMCSLRPLLWLCPQAPAVPRTLTTLESPKLGWFSLKVQGQGAAIRDAWQGGSQDTPGPASPPSRPLRRELWWTMLVYLQLGMILETETHTTTPVVKTKEGPTVQPGELVKKATGTSLPNTSALSPIPFPGPSPWMRWQPGASVPTLFPQASLNPQACDDGMTTWAASQMVSRL